MIRIEHYGPSVGDLGGMETVLRTYAAAPWKSLQISVIPSTTRGTIASRIVIFARSIRQVRRRRASSVVHLHLSQRGSFLREGLLAIICPPSRVRVATIHGSSFVSTAASRLWRPIYTTVLRRLSGIAVLNEAAMRVVEELAPGTHAIILPNPGPVFSPPSDEQRVRDPEKTTVLFGGRIGLRKGIDVLMPAWDLVLKQKPDAVLRLSGPIDEEIGGSLRDAVDRHHVGALSGSQVVDLLRVTDIAVLPSRAEGQPMFLIEALGCGVPIVVTDVGGMPGLAESCGEVVPVGSADALAAAIVKIMSDGELMEDLSDRAFAKYRREFSVRAHEDRLVALYEDARYSHGKTTRRRPRR